MNKLKGSIWAKTFAIILLVITAFAVLASAVGIVALAELDAYPDNNTTFKRQVLESVCREYTYNAVERMYNYDANLNDLMMDDSFRVVITDTEGKVVYDGLGGAETQASYGWEILSEHVKRAIESSNMTMPVTVSPKASIPVTATPSPDDSRTGDYIIYDDNGVSYSNAAEAGVEVYTVTGYILEDLAPEGSVAALLRLADFAFGARYALIVILVLSVIFAILLFIFLLCAAGHRQERAEIVPTAIDKIPFDLFTVLIGCLFAAVFACASGLPSSVAVVLMLGSVLAVCAILLAILFFMSFAVRIKLGTLIKGCLVYKLCAMIIHGIRCAWRCCKILIKKLPLVKRTAVVAAILLAVEFIYLIACYGDGGLLFIGWFIERAALVAFALYCAISMRKLEDAGRALAAGNMAYRVDTAKLPAPLREHGGDLNNIGDGLNKAVGERMKSEHFKTELITNVSHDIKTPLTSIINYVDLLAKEEPESEKTREYIEVLSRQSAKLKKLIEDLIEASKASTGNLSVELKRCELGVLLTQTEGEYEEKLATAGLELVLTKPESPVSIMADGRHMWRILDNLLGNICKYSLRGTRVYIDLSSADSKALISFKNISENKLNVSGNELMERFVRGDSSRNTEGSGLGLSIAESLVKLQNGEMKLSVDGDLFKVELTFNTVE